jgi:O-antigen/teichoic acid export membrane protein
LPGQSRLSSRAFWGLASWALPLAVVFVISPKLLHLLGADRFGVLMVALITPLVAAQLDFGVSAAGVRRIASLPMGAKIDGEMLLTLFAALAAIGLLLGGALWLAAEPVSHAIGFASVLPLSDAVALVRTCALWVAVSLAALLPGVAARALQKFALITALQTLGTFLLWSAALLLVSRGFRLESVIWLGITLTAAFGGSTLYAIGRSVDWRGPWRLRPQILREDLRFAGGMFAAQAASSAVYQGDRILISALGSPAVAGLYALCTNVANKTAAAVAALSSFVFPHAAELHSAQRRDRLAGLLHALDRVIAVLVMPVLLPAVFLASSFLSLWIGAYATDEVVTAFRILIIAFAVPAFAVPVSNILLGTGQSGLPARFAWLTVGVIVIALILLVPSHGLVGAAVAMLLANSTSLAFSLVARRFLGFDRPARAAHFWGGIALGLGVQAALLAMLAPWSTDWWTLVTIGVATWSAFFIVRVIVSSQSPEERAMFLRIRQRLISL